MKVEIYTDGSALQNVVGGYAAVMFVDGVRIDTVYGGAPKATNNQMELMGLIAGMKLLPVLDRIYCKNCGLTEHVPSQKTVDGLMTIVMSDVKDCPMTDDCLKYNKWVTRTPIYKDVTIISDSQYCIKGATFWLSAWKTNGWKTKSKTPVKNQELWQEVDALQKLYMPEFQWVKGHIGVAGNELADQLAGTAMSMPQSKKGEWSAKL